MSSFKPKREEVQDYNNFRKCKKCTIQSTWRTHEPRWKESNDFIRPLQYVLLKFTDMVLLIDRKMFSLRFQVCLDNVGLTFEILKCHSLNRNFKQVTPRRDCQFSIKEALQKDSNQRLRSYWLCGGCRLRFISQPRQVSLTSPHPIIPIPTTKTTIMVAFHMVFRCCFTENTATIKTTESRKTQRR